MSTDSSSPSPATTTTRTPLPPDDTLARLERSVRQGDWTAVTRLTTILTSESVPQTSDALGEYLRRLGAVLVDARVGRAGLARSLNRLHAAAKFTDSRALDGCHISVIPAKF